MDGIDGKQAKRTNSCSIVGEILDHGFDAIILEAILLIAGAATCRGNNGYFLLIYVYGFCSCVMPEWEKYHTNRLFMSSLNGAVDGYFFAIAIYLLAAYQGIAHFKSNF